MTLQFPSSPTTGQTYPSPAIPGSPWWVWDGAKWSSRGLANAIVSTSAMPPLNPRVGDLWFDPNEGQLYVWFDDGNSQQWVVAINQGLNRPVNMGVTDGSSAQPGEVGELLSNTLVQPQVNVNAGVIINTLQLTPGDWDAWAVLTTTNLNMDLTINTVAGSLAITGEMPDYWDFQIYITQGATGVPWSFGLVPHRFNVTIPTNVSIYVYVGGQTLGANWPPTFLSTINARRMR